MTDTHTAAATNASPGPLTGRVAVVTGAAAGIGAAIATALATFLQRSAITVGLAAKLSLTLHTSTGGNHAILVLTTPDGREAIVEVGCAVPQSELKRHRSYSSAGEGWFRLHETDGSATFTSFDAALSEPPPTWTAILCMTGVWGRSRARSASVSADCRPRANWRMSCGSSGGPTRLTEKGLHDG
jgi:hypothetical protein